MNCLNENDLASRNPARLLTQSRRRGFVTPQCLMIDVGGKYSCIYGKATDTDTKKPDICAKTSDIDTKTSDIYTKTTGNDAKLPDFNTKTSDIDTKTSAISTKTSDDDAKQSEDHAK